MLSWKLNCGAQVAMEAAQGNKHTEFTTSCTEQTPHHGETL